VRAHFQNSGLRGQPRGYSLAVHHYEKTILRRNTAIYEFRLDADTPLTFAGADGVLWRPDRYFLTDLGSVPKVLQIALPKDECLGYLFHDSAYAHGGLWCSFLGSAWAFTKMDRSEADALLRAMVAAQWGWPKAAAVWAGVRLGGWASWSPSKHRARQARWRGQARASA
jgi:hypothetical protein